MADINELIANSAKTDPRMWEAIGNLPKAYYEGQENAYKQKMRDVFSEEKGGLPRGPDGNVDFQKAFERLVTTGGAPAIESAGSLANAGLTQDRIRYAPTVQGAIDGSDLRPQAPTTHLPPSGSRNAPATVMPALARGGAAAPDGGQPGKPQGRAGSIMEILSAQGIPNDQLGAASTSIARQLGDVDPNAKLNLDDPQIRNVLAPAVAQLKRMGIGQVVPDGQPSPAPQVIPQQGQPVAQMQPQSVAQMQPQAPQMAPQAPQQAPQAGGMGGDPTLGGLVPPGYQPGPYLTRLQAIAASGRVLPDQLKVLEQKIAAIQTALQPTAPMKEYAHAVSQGYEGTALDYQAESAARGATETERAKGDVKEQQDYIAQGRQAQARLGTLNTISNIISSDKNLSLGYGGPTSLKIKMALEQAGFDFGDLSGAQSIQKLNGILASESAKAFSSRPTQFEFKTFLANNPGLELDEKGNIRMLGILSQTAKREADLGKLARQNRDNWDNWDNVVEKYDRDNPIKDPTSGKVLSSHSIIAPGPAKGAAPPVPNARQAPDGNFYVPDPKRPGKYLKVIQ